METIRWGIAGTGGMAAAVAAAIRDEPDAEVVAVSSRDADRARTFAGAVGAEHAVTSVAELAARPVDAVYVASTNDRHHQDALDAIAGGRAVLCEKPFTLHADEALEVVQAARGAGVFLMEAMWMRFHPAFLELERLVGEGAIGRPRLVQADFGFPADPDPTARWLSAALGGGALLDIGVYPLTLAVSLLGAPTEARALAEMASTGVDAQLSVAMRHADGLSSWSSSFLVDSGVEATVAGEDGSLRLHAPFHHASELTRRVRGRVVERVEVGAEENGYAYEVREVHRCLRAGATESPRMPLDLTLLIMRWLDEIGRQIGDRRA